VQLLVPAPLKTMLPWKIASVEDPRSSICEE
jgi:hypothetical protein